MEVFTFCVYLVYNSGLYQHKTQLPFSLFHTQLLSILQPAVDVTRYNTISHVEYHGVHIILSLCAYLAHYSRQRLSLELCRQQYNGQCYVKMQLNPVEPYYNMNYGGTFNQSAQNAQCLSFHSDLATCSMSDKCGRPQNMGYIMCSFLN